MADEANAPIHFPDKPDPIAWSNTTRYIVFFLVLAAGIWFLTMIRPLISPLIVSCFLATLLNPGVAYLSRRTHLRRTYVVFFIYILGLLLIAGALAILIPYLIEQTGILSRELLLVRQEIDRRLAEQGSWQIAGFLISWEDLWRQWQAPSTQFLEPESLLLMLESITQNFLWVLVILLSTYYLLLDWTRLRDWLFGLAPPVYQGDVRRLYEEIRLTWRAYLRGQLVLMLVLGIICSVAGAIVGLPGAVAIGILTGVFSMIPSVGLLIGLVVATLVAFFEGSSFAYLHLSNMFFAVLVAGIYYGIHGLENVWLRPRIMGQSVKLHHGVAFVAIIASLALSNVLVMLLVIPFISTILIIGHYLRCRIFGLDPWLVETKMPHTLPTP